MKHLVVILSAILLFPVVSFADTTTTTMETNCQKPKAAALVPHKKKIVKKKPVREVAPPVVVREVVKEYVPVPIPVAAPVLPVAPVIEQEIIPVRRHHHVDASHPVDTDNLPYPAYNPYYGFGGGPFVSGTHFGALGTLGAGFGLGYGINH